VERGSTEVRTPPGRRRRVANLPRLFVRRELAGIIAKLGPLSEQHGLLRFSKNVDHANTLNGFVQELIYVVTDYQVCVTKSTLRTI